MSAEAKRRFPDGLEVTVTEREPAGLVLLGGLYLAERDGRLFKRAAVHRGEAEDLVVITGLSRDLFVRHPELGTALVESALDIVERWNAKKGRPGIGEVHVDRAGYTLFTYSGAVAIELGRAASDDLDERLERFDLAWSALTPEEREQVRTIHLDSTTRPDRITVSMAETR